MINIESFASGSSANFYIATTGKTKIILECGVDEDMIFSAMNRAKMKFEDINACFISHSHLDHAKNVKFLQNRGIHCYCTVETFNRYLLNMEDTTILEDEKNYLINNELYVKPIRVNHGKTECYAFILADKEDIVLFMTDFMSFDKTLLNFNFTQLWIECNYIESKLNVKLENEENEFMKTKHLRQLNTHQSLNNLIFNLKNKININKCTEINLIHISKDVGNYELMQNAIEDEFGIPTYAILWNGAKY